ncbi:MAG: Ig-like domain-containing protein [Chloroflexi bacterium]|nr:Ig-like domain-containing protein [Chloroflexota bacterium]
MTVNTRTRNLIHIFVVLALLLSLLGGLVPSTVNVASATGSTWFVRASAPAGGNGTSWGTAYNDLQSALSSAASGDQIWVAAGTYKPASGTDRNATFRMKNDVAIYGGFAGTETSLDQRDWKANVTILSGNIGDTGVSTDNSYHVVTASTLAMPSNTSAVLDGFTITGGYGPAPGAGIYQDYGATTFRNLIVTGNATGDVNYGGGGMFYWSNDTAWTTLTNVTFSNNQASVSGGGLFATGKIALDNVDFDSNTAGADGGGMATTSQYQYPTLNNVRFTGNQAAGSGGGFSDIGANAVLTNVQFTGNECSSTSRGGGGMDVYTGSPSLTNVLFRGNISNSYGGGGLYVFPGTAVLTNVTIANNSAPDWSEFFAQSLTTQTIANSIIWGAGANGGWFAGEYTATYSDLKDQWGGVYPGTGNIDANPQFVSSTDLHLQLTSPCIDKGDNTAVPSGVTTDLDGNPRIFNGTVDMGAYEAQVVPGSVIYVNAGATPPGDGTSWGTAYTSLQSALSAATSGKQIWVAAGTYKPGATDRTATFALKNGVAIYGGFSGGEISPNQRNSDPATNGTILSGDVGTAGTATDNSYHVVTGSGVDSSAILDGFTITGGNANYTVYPTYHGGGLYIEASSAGSPTLRNLKFDGNFASQYGGGAYLGAGNTSLTNVTFTNNHANSGGGAACVYIGSPTFTDVTFTNNYTSVNGKGGAVYLDSPSPTNVTMTNVTFQGNSSATAGGAINMVPGYGGINLTINGGTFNSNSSSGDGGAIYGDNQNSYYTMKADLTNVKFTGNTAAGSGGSTGANGGGAIRWGGSGLSNELKVTNCLFQGNQATGATGAGGAINVYSYSTATITNCTFSGNTNAAGSAGALRLGMNITCNVSNSIFWSDSSPEISSASPLQPAVSYSDVQGSYAGTKNINLDPKFTSGFHLGAGSPCIDAGNNSVITAGTDLDGNPRFKDDTGTPDTGSGTAPIVDMGAYEFQGTTPATAPSITSANNTTFTAGTAGTFNITATGTAPISISQTGTLPNGVTFVDNSNGTATLSGTPAAGSGKIYPLTITATNSGGNISQPFTLTINESPKFTSPASTTFMIGQTGVFTVTTSGYPIPTISKTMGTYNFHDNGDGTATISGTPASTEGADMIYLVASNGISPDATQTLTINRVAPDTAPQITSPDHTTLTVGASGTFTVTATGKPTPSISKTGALPAGVSFGQYMAGPYLLQGTPSSGTGGVYPLTITASNGISPDATQAFTLTVNEKPYVTTQPQDVTIIVGNMATFTAAASGYPTPTVQWEGSLDGSYWAYLPGETNTTLSIGDSWAGWRFRARFTNVAGTTYSGAATLTVTNPVPAITSANSTTFTAGTYGGFLITTTGNPTPTITVTGTLPAGITFRDRGDGTATMNGTPAAHSGGVYPLVITASNSSGQDTHNFTFTVNEAPQITSASSVTFVIGQYNSFTVSTTGYPISAISSTLGEPLWMSIVDNHDGTATISGTPNEGAGIDYIHLKASNGVSPDATQTLTITEVVPTTAPQITSANNTTFTAGTPGSFTVTTTGDPTSTITKTGSLPGGVSFVDNANGTATLSGTPAAHSGAAYSLIITASNGTTPNATQTFTLTVNEAPYLITQPQGVTVAMGETAVFTSTASGYPAPTVQWQSNDGFGWADITGATSTTLELQSVGTSKNNWQYRAVFTNSQGSANSNAATLTVTTTNNPPVAQDQNVTATAGVAKTITLVATDADPGDSLTYSIVTTPTHGTLSAVSGNQVTYTPASDYTGPDTFTFKANDGKTDSNVAQVSITVSAPTSSPVFTNADTTTFMVGQSGTFTVTTTGNPTPTLQVFYAPAWLSVVYNGDGTVTLSGTPPSGQNVYLTIMANNIVDTVYQDLTLHCYQAASITTQPTDQTATVGGTATFTVAVAGYPNPSINWQCSTDGGATFTTIADEHQTSLTLSNVLQTMNGWKYKAVVSNAVNTLYSNVATLTVTAASTAPQFTSPATATFAVGSFRLFSVTTSGNPVPWVSKTGSMPSGVDFASNSGGGATIVGTPAAHSGGLYPLTLTATNGTLPDATQYFTLTVNEAPYVTTDPQSQTKTAGETATFTAARSGYPTPTVQWQQLTTASGATWADMSGEISTTLTLSSVTTDMEGYQYRAVFTNSQGSATSNAATLTVNNPAPVLSTIDPATAQAGDGGFTLTVTGSGFLSGSVVRWNGADLTTTFVNSTQLTASVPAANIASAGTAEITVFNPTPGGGSSALLGFFVTPSTTTVTSQDVGTGSDPAASTADVTATGTGEGTVIVAEYSGNPGGSALSTFTGAYFDVYVSSSSSLTSLTVEACNLNGATTIYWWSGTEWVSVSPQSYDSTTGCVTMTLDGSSTPSIGQLNGSIFAGGTLNTAPVANPVSVATNQGTPVTITLDATDADGDPLTYSVVSGPSHGTLSAITGDQVTYTPSAGYYGSDSFTYKANDGKADSNTATVSITVNQVLTQADPSVRLSASPNPVNAGANLTYSIVASNSSLGIAQNPVVTFDVPAGTTFVSATAPTGWTPTKPNAGGTGTVTFTKTSMATGERTTFTVVVKVDSAATGTVSGTANITSNNQDPNTANNTSTVTTNVRNRADVKITQDAPAYNSSTKTITWTIKVTNNGPSTAQGLEIKDNLAKGTTFKSIVVPSGATYKVVNNSNVTVDLDSLAAGETATITIEVQLNKPVGTFSNTASVKTTSYDPVSTNNSCTASKKF